MKIWHGNEYNTRGESQLAGYLEDYHLSVGYMISFNFNKNKRIGGVEQMTGTYFVMCMMNTVRSSCASYRLFS